MAGAQPGSGAVWCGVAGGHRAPRLARRGTRLVAGGPRGAQRAQRTWFSSTRSMVGTSVMPRNCTITSSGTLAANTAWAGATQARHGEPGKLWRARVLRPTGGAASDAELETWAGAQTGRCRLTAGQRMQPATQAGADCGAAGLTPGVLLHVSDARHRAADGDLQERGRARERRCNMRHLQRSALERHGRRARATHRAALRGAVGPGPRLPTCDSWRRVGFLPAARPRTSSPMGPDAAASTKLFMP